jgi:two-component system, chemotaxis family, protein-glutamate methylesterase/glutaminase
VGDTASGDDRTAFDVVVLCASLGGTSSLRAIVSALPATFPVPVLVVQHRLEAAPDLLVPLLASLTDLPTQLCEHDDHMTPGIWVVPARHAVELDHSRLRVVRCHDHAADRTLIEMAAALGPRVLGAILTGRRDDGAQGAQAVKRAGGVILVEDPVTARAPEMPRATLATGCADHRLSAALIGRAVVALVMATGVRELLAVPLAAWAQVSSS